MLAIKINQPLILVNVDCNDWLNLQSLEFWQEAITFNAMQTLNYLYGEPQDYEISFLLTNNQAMQELNYNYRKQNKPTNVLSFPNVEFEDLPNVNSNETQQQAIGDIALAFETINDEANAANISFLNHFNHLVVHGTLHLLGYDHLTDEQAQHMELKEIAILELLNIKNPYLNIK